MQRLNPYAKTKAALEAKAAETRKAARKAAVKAKLSKAGRKDKAARNKAFAKIDSEIEAAFVAADKIVQDEIKAGKFDASSDSDDE